MAYFAWSVEYAQISDEQELSTVFFVATCLFLLHGATHLAIVLSAPTLGSPCGLPVPPGATTPPVEAKGLKDPIFSVLAATPKLARSVNLEGNFRVLYYASETEAETTYHLTFMPPKDVHIKYTNNPSVTECDIVAPKPLHVPSTASASSSSSSSSMTNNDDDDKEDLPPTPFIVESSVLTRSMTPQEERRRWAPVLAHQVASLAAVCVLSGLGAQQWWSNSNNSSMQFLHHEIALIDQRAYNGEPLHAAERHYITHGPGLLIGQMALAYQIYELVMTIAIADIRTVLMIAHHVAAAFILVATIYPHCLGFGGDKPTGQYDLVLFYGVMELSSVPLILHDALRIMPVHLGKSSFLRTINDIAKFAFALTFLVVRCVIFPLNFRGHWGALIVQLENGTAHAPLLLYATLIVSVLLGGLQFFWGYKIIAILWTFASESAAQILEEDAKEQMKKEEAKEKKKTK